MIYMWSWRSASKESTRLADLKRSLKCIEVFKAHQLLLAIH